MGRRPRRDAAAGALLIVVDSSAWIEFLRATGSETHHRLRELIDSGADLAVTEVVVMELLGGVSGSRAALRSRLLSYPVLPLQGFQDYEEAALIYRRCRRAGDMLSRGYSDCLIAIPTIREGAQIFHRNGDFEVIARHSDLQLAS